MCGGFRPGRFKSGALASGMWRALCLSGLQTTPPPAGRSLTNELLVDVRPVEVGTVVEGDSQLTGPQQAGLRLILARRILLGCIEACEHQEGSGQRARVCCSCRPGGSGRRRGGRGGRGGEVRASVRCWRDQRHLHACCGPFALHAMLRTVRGASNLRPMPSDLIVGSTGLPGQ